MRPWESIVGEELGALGEAIDRNRLAKRMTELLAERLACWSMVYRAETTIDGMRLGMAASTGFGDDAVDTFEAHLSRMQQPRFGHYDPLRPEAAQRDVVLGDAELSTLSPMMTAIYRDIGILGRSQFRVLVCDGPMLLGWVGGFRDEPFAADERALVQRAVPVLRRRLRLEHALSGDGVHHALDVAMENLAVPAWLVRATGSVVHSNEAGAVLLREDRQTTVALFRDALAGVPEAVARVEIIPISARDTPPFHFVMLRGGGRGAVEMSTAQARWRLSRRECEVLSLLTLGSSNKDIATKLRAAISTIEIHVSAILKKSRCESRAQVVARFWLGE